MTIATDIVELGASFFRRGLTFGRTGNLSAVDSDGTIIMTPTGVSLEHLSAGSLSRVAPDGEHIAGPPPTKEAFLHLAIYRARPTARAVVHTHSTHSVAVSCLRDVDASTHRAVTAAGNAANSYGVGVVAVRNSNHFGTAAYWISSGDRIRTFGLWVMS